MLQRCFSGARSGVIGISHRLSRIASRYLITGGSLRSACELTDEEKQDRVAWSGGRIRRHASER